MFEQVLRFFIKNYKLNYVLSIFIFVFGIYFYKQAPKEIFPNFELDYINITGSYAGASVEILDNMAVKYIEDNVKNIAGIKDIATIINPGRFSIILEIKKGFDKNTILNKVKDAVSLSRKNFPKDMNEPTTVILDISQELISLVLSSNTLKASKLKDVAKELKTKLLTIKNISEVTIYGKSNKEYKILLNDKKIDMYGFDKRDVFNIISQISYIFPLGKIEDINNHFFVSTYNGKKSIKDLENTIIKINNKKLYLSDIAIIKKQYKKENTLYSYNTNEAISLNIKQSRIGNAVVIVQNVKKIISKFQRDNPDILVTISKDYSLKIKDRLDIIFSNILLGFILIATLVSFLINWRISFVISIGIPTSFVIGMIYFYYTDYTINVITLIGVLLAIGILVDDAIVVSENIQQYIEKGLPPKEAVIIGTKEMFKPVTIASLTTLFSFIPSLMITGTLGEVVKLIPITFSILVVASLIESFIFLPLHSIHLLKADSKTRSWQKANLLYSKLIIKAIKNRKKFIILFFLSITFIIFLSASFLKFQMFPEFDSETINISIKADVNTKLKDSFAIAQKIEKELFKNRDRFYIKSTSSIAGFRINSASKIENYPYVMYVSAELYKLEPQNIVDRFITPYLSFYYNKENRIRKKRSLEVSNDIREFLKNRNFIKKFNLTELTVLDDKVGAIKSDIAIGLSSKDKKQIKTSIARLKDEISAIKGVKSVFSGLAYGPKEIKLKISPYGESLGISEGYIGTILSNLYLQKKKATIFDKHDALDVNIQLENKDSLKYFKNIEIPLKNGKMVLLEDVCDIQIVSSFEKLTKNNGEVSFYLYANVNPKIITASEVLSKLNKTIKELKNNGIKINIKGEDKQKRELGHSMMFATMVAMFLIFISLLYLFNSFKDSFVVLSIIPLSLLGVLIGHIIMNLNIGLTSLIGALGLSGIVVNDGILMMTYLKKAKNLNDIYSYSSKRLRPIFLTTLTTLIGMSSLIFFPTGQAVIFQQMAVSIGFGLFWGTILNLIYLPVIFVFLNRIK